MTQQEMAGWGRYLVANMSPKLLANVDEAASLVVTTGKEGIISYGGGRSYGDQALNTGGRAIVTTALNRVLAFDEKTGLIRVEPGITFGDLLRQFLPRGWIVPVSPGTGFVTIGGAVANDVHGKNHDCYGSFGRYVRAIELILPDGTICRSSPSERSELFYATLGGCGLTGFIKAIEFILMRVSSNAVECRKERIGDLDRFLSCLIEARGIAHYSVGWIDALARGRILGRGILETAHLAEESIKVKRKRPLALSYNLPSFILNHWSVSVFNSIYFNRIPKFGSEQRMAIETFLYPLDAVLHWNRMYGRRGMHQFQCVLPYDTAPVGLRYMLEVISTSGNASFLAVLKTLGEESGGFLSFPRPGVTLALDFPHRTGTLELLARLEKITLDHGGRIYLAKDSALKAASLVSMYPKLDRFLAVLNTYSPKKRFFSDMARRLAIMR